MFVLLALQIAQAAAALASNLLASEKKSKGGRAGFAGPGKKLSVEIPVADESDSASLALTRDLIEALPQTLRSQVTVLTCTTSIKAITFPAVSLSDCASGAADLQGKGCLFVVAPRTEHLSLLERTLARCRTPAVVLVNAEWAANGGEPSAGVPQESTSFALSFDVAYCFMPILIKVFLFCSRNSI